MADAGSGLVASASFLPAAEGYDAGNIIGGVQEFIFKHGDGTPVRSGALIRVISSVVKIAEPVAAGPSLWLQLFSVTPPCAQADNDMFALGPADLAAYRGALSLGCPLDLGGASFVKTQYSDQQDFSLAGNSLFGRLVTVGAFTANAVARQVSLFGFEV